MKQIKQLLEARKSCLLNLKRQKEKALQDAPGGSLRILKKVKKPFFSSV